MEDYIVALSEAQSDIVDAARQHQQSVIDAYLAKSPEGPTEFAAGDYVLVSYPDRPPSKLHPRWRGPMLVVDRADTVYQVQDMNTLKVSPVHVSRLKSFNDDQTDDYVAAAAVDAAEYVVDAIVDHRQGPTVADQRFRVRWRGYSPAEDSWMSHAELRDVIAYREYRLAHPELDI